MDVKTRRALLRRALLVASLAAISAVTEFAKEQLNSQPMPGQSAADTSSRTEAATPAGNDQ